MALVCLSARKSVTLVIHVKVVQYIEMFFAPYDTAMSDVRSL